VKLTVTTNDEPDTEAPAAADPPTDNGPPIIPPR
jgi:hypothetical protein